MITLFIFTNFIYLQYSVEAYLKNIWKKKPLNRNEQIDKIYASLAPVFIQPIHV